MDKLLCRDKSYTGNQLARTNVQRASTSMINFDLASRPIKVNRSAPRYTKHQSGDAPPSFQGKNNQPAVVSLPKY
jgi:hypothetical protein